jgi:transcription antitermination factor NusG
MRASRKPSSVLLGRYTFVELDPQRQSFLPITTTPGIDAVISAIPVPRADVDDLFDRYLAGEFNETKGGPPIGARVAIVEGRFENWLATATGLAKDGKQSPSSFSVTKLLSISFPDGRFVRPSISIFSAATRRSFSVKASMIERAHLE